MIKRIPTVIASALLLAGLIVASGFVPAGEDAGAADGQQGSCASSRCW